MNATRLGAGLLPVFALTASVSLAQTREALPSTSIQPANLTEIRVPGKTAVARVWSEGGVPHYSVSLDGRTFSAKKATSYDLLLRYERFDPAGATPRIPSNLKAASDNRLMIVQYWTQGLEDYRQSIREVGGEIHFFLANHSNVVEMDAATAQAVAAMPFVRSVSPFHPAFKLEEELLEALADRTAGEVAVNVLVTRRGGQAGAVKWIEESGGEVFHVSDPTWLLSAKLPYAQLAGLAARSDVKWIDRWSAPESDMNVARAVGGANVAENAGGYVGNGLRFEVMDGGSELTHPDLTNGMFHNSTAASSHGTCCAGIVAGSGAGNAQARGMCPEAFIISANYNAPYAGGSRFAHSAELADPAGPYRACFQTNSWGNSRTTAYTSISAEMDTILFDLDHLSITQSQSNAGNQQSRPQAWSKNIISVGALFHRNTPQFSDDSWSRGASIGPAADGRIKPDLASFYDQILCTDRVGGLGYSGSNYFTNFGGTSGATPIVAGALGLFYDIWSSGLLGNASTGDPFDDAPTNTLAKAFLIATASQWRFEGALHDRTRTHQGWGHPNVANLINFSTEFDWVDETDPIGNLQTATYQYTTDPGDQQLRITMVYRDPGGTTSSTLHRINNVDLLVRSPSGVVYHGNNGLDIQPFSLAGGSPNNVDTVENVWVRNPEPGAWTIEVTASDVNADTHSETPAVDVDFSLVMFSGAPSQG